MEQQNGCWYVNTMTGTDKCKLLYIFLFLLWEPWSPLFSHMTYLHISAIKNQTCNDKDEDKDHYHIKSIVKKAKKRKKVWRNGVGDWSRQKNEGFKISCKKALFTLHAQTTTRTFTTPNNSIKFITS